MKKRCIVICALLLMLATSFLVTPVSAQGIFDKECPTCGGKGWIACQACGGDGWNPCSTCGGDGLVTCTACGGRGYAICHVCGGGGWIWQDQTCHVCRGAGKLTATITRTSLDSRWMMIGFDWFLEITATFYNEEDQGTYGTVYAYTQRYQEIYDEGRKRVWFPAHESVTVKMTLDIKSDGADWYYNMYVESSDPITCLTCGGDGKVTVQASCTTCGGDGKITCATCRGRGEATCATCGGDGNIPCNICEGGRLHCDICGRDGKVTCPYCNGSGYVTDWTKVGIVSVVGVGAIIGVVAFAITRKKKPV